jgi:hypothetical protein
MDGIALRRNFNYVQRRPLQGGDRAGRARNNSGSLAMFTAILRASSFDSIFAANCRPG